MRRKPGRARLRALQLCARQAQKRAELPAEPRQRVGGADVGNHADAGLGHGDQRALGRDAVCAVHRQSDAASHGDAVDERDVRLGVFGDRLVHPVFVMEEALPIGRSGAAGGVDRHDIAPGAKGAAAAAANDNGFHRVVGQPVEQLPVPGDAHRAVERIQRLRPVEGGETDAAAAFE